MQRGGKLGLPEFAEYLGVPVSDTLEDMFSLFDEVGPSPWEGFRGKTSSFPMHIVFVRSSLGIWEVEGEMAPPRPTSPPCHLGIFSRAF